MPSNVWRAIAQSVVHKKADETPGSYEPYLLDGQNVIIQDVQTGIDTYKNMQLTPMIKALRKFSEQIPLVYCGTKSPTDITNSQYKVCITYTP